MSEFEFLSRLPIGQYVPTGSLLHRLDPRAKIVIFTSLVLVITFTPSRIGLGIGIVFLLIGILLSKIKPGYVLKGLLPPLPFLVFIAIIQIVFYSPAVDTIPLFNIGRLNITLAGIWVGVLILIRFSALILCLSLASLSISSSELIHGLLRLLSPLNRLKIKTIDMVMVIQVMLRFLPFLTQSAERIAKAQASRGAEWGIKSRGLFTRIRQVVPLIIPLFLISLRRAENLALAMDARAYGYLDTHTSMQELHFTWLDFGIVALNTIVSFVIIYA